MEELSFDRHESQSDDIYTTPISPLSPLEKSPPPAPLPLNIPPVIISFENQSSEEKDEFDVVNEMQTLIQSTNDLTFPLEDSWTFWYFKNDRMSDWKDNLIKITTVSTVEHFWSVFNHLKSASRLDHNCDYSLFKTHIVRREIFYS